MTDTTPASGEFLISSVAIVDAFSKLKERGIIPKRSCDPHHALFGRKFLPLGETCRSRSTCQFKEYSFIHPRNIDEGLKF